MSLSHSLIPLEGKGLIGLCFGEFPRERGLITLGTIESTLSRARDSLDNGERGGDLRDERKQNEEARRGAHFQALAREHRLLCGTRLGEREDGEAEGIFFSLPPPDQEQGGQRKTRGED